MSVFHNNALIGSGAGTGAVAAAEYVIPKSLRFNAADGSNLSKNFSLAGNTKTWTWSTWVKFHNNTGTQVILNSANGNNFHSLYLNSNAKLKWDDVIGGSDVQINLIPDLLIRDFSSFYHIVLAVDTTQSTAADRNKMYINGVQVTYESGNNFSQNDNSQFNQGSAFTVNIGSGYNASHSNVTLADVQFVDGQQLAPTDFGETRSSDGVWVPKEFTRTSPNDGTVWSNSVSNAANNSATKMFDGNLGSYTEGSTDETAVTWSGNISGSTIEFYAAQNSGTRTFSVNGVDRLSLVPSTNPGWFTIPDTTSLTAISFSRGAPSGGFVDVYAIRVDGEIVQDSFNNSSGYGRNGFHLNFSDSSTIEALGFDSAPTIPDLDPKNGMDVVTYTGNGGTQNIGGLSFEPGLVWVKSRTTTQNHKLFDIIRGTGKELVANSTAAEYSDSNQLSAFNPDGFSVGSGLAVNQSSQNYVAWTWRAGGPAVANSNGTITSQVSANTDYGFSIVTYTGSAGGTVGHGLGSAPKLIIAKSRTQTKTWPVYTSVTGKDKYLVLNSDTAEQSASGVWGSSEPTSTVFGIENSSTGGNVHGDIVAYCWSEVSGFSKFGSYSGSGASGNAITTGFKPRFLILKRTSAAENWLFIDSERGDNLLFANLSNAEASSDVVDFTDDGFTLKQTGAASNASGSTYFYAAFADRPGNNWDVNNIVTNEGLTTSKTQFDVVTYTGNGGTSAIGGPVYSATSNLSNPANAFDGDTSTGSVFNSTGNSVLTAGSITITSSLEIFHNRTGSDGITLNINGTNYTATGLGSNGYHTIPIPGSDLPLTTTGNITIKDNQSGASSTVYAVRVDSNVLVDGTGVPLKFQPDLVWLKSRSHSYDHYLTDSVRGVTKSLRSNTTAAEDTLTQGLTAFNSSGFSLGNEGQFNNTGRTYVAWCWKAGGTAASNTDGSITSSVSANAQHGFSVVKWTGVTWSGNNPQTIGHGLNGKVPKLIIVKNLDRAVDWGVYAEPLGNTTMLELNQDGGAETADSGYWNNTSPTGSVFTTGNGYGYRTGGINEEFVAYCFADVPGYQRIGTYTGNGSSTGPVVVTGFKPRFLLVKNTNSSRNWVLWDTERDNNDTLKANSSGTEESSYQVDALSNGFQIKNTWNEFNENGATIIYLAIGDDEIGSDEDCLVDVPNAVTADADATDTTGGYQRGNYATWNPLDTKLVQSNGNLDATASTSQTWVTGRGTMAMTSGKFYWEVTINSLSTTSDTAVQLGIGALTAALPSNDGAADSNAYVYLNSNGQKMSGGSAASYGSSYTTGDVIGVAFDADNGTLAFYKNGISQGTAYSSFDTDKQYAPLVSLGRSSTSTSISANFGQMRFKYPMPSGYAALNTTALPAATIADGSAQFSTTLWTGNGSNGRAITLMDSWDLLWFKQRSSTQYHYLEDRVRGTGKMLYSNATTAEEGPDSTKVQSHTADGITVGTDGAVNASGQTYVAWTWNAGANSNKTYTVKVVSDSGNKYRFDDFGTSAVTLDLAEGSTYIFDQSDSSNAGHPIRFGTSANGTDYTTGVTHTGTPGSAGAKTTLVLGTGVATLYYSCANHSGMGGQINTNSTAGASNFDGSVQTTVKANPEAGFSIVTGSGNSGTLGHGLNAIPDFVVVKQRNNTDVVHWAITHTGLGTMKDNILFFTTGAKVNQSNFWGSSAFSTTSFPISGNITTSGATFVAYCFTAVAGYSAFGSYTGNGSTDGPFIHTGFKVAFLIQKRTDSTGNWRIRDTKRGTYNAIEDVLYADTNASTITEDPYDFLSNGFKIRTSGPHNNASGGSYIYIAFAENPFQANGGLAR